MITYSTGTQCDCEEEYTTQCDVLESALRELFTDSECISQCTNVKQGTFSLVTDVTVHLHEERGATASITLIVCGEKQLSCDKPKLRKLLALKLPQFNETCKVEKRFVACELVEE